MELGLFQKQTMNLVMTTELRQAIALLQYSTVDLARFIQEQALENPLIDLEEKTSELHFDYDYGDYSPKNHHHVMDSEATSPLDYITGDDPGTRNDLLEQAKFLKISEQEHSLLQYLILSLDDNGYLQVATSEIAGQLNLSEEIIVHGIQLLQQLDPAGIGAQNLQECLFLQVQRLYPEEPLLAQVVMEHLELLAEKKWQEIAKKMGITLTEVKRIAECIQTLEPKPYASCTQTKTQYLVPDVTIIKTGEGYSITMNDHYLPKIQVNQQYMNLSNNHNSTSNYIKENYQKYMWLVKSMEQRKSTILKITKTIIEKQRDFLEHGFSHLQPMTLKDVAAQIDMHESTVSRATNNKVIRTPNGAFEMRQLFTTSIGKAGENNTSSVKVKLLLKQLINEEDKRKPLSDQKIADYFKGKNGITISRRTVAKYREELNILSSAKRKTIV